MVNFYVIKHNGMTRSAFVQMIHFLHLNWADIKDLDATGVKADVQSRLRNQSGQLVLRTKQQTVQAILSPTYTPFDNADVLRTAGAALDLSKAQVTVYRGNLRITGVSDAVTFQPDVGDIISGGWEITNNEFGKGVFSVNQFLLRLVCTNGAVVRSRNRGERYVHRGWDKDGLVRHVGEIGAQTIAQTRLNEALRALTQTSIGESRLNDLGRRSAPHLGRKGFDTFQTKLSPDSSLYDAYNHLTFVSQRKPLGPRRELELIAGDMLGV